jgi:hypothetical protein
MAEKLDPSELVSIKELLTANSIQVDALAEFLIDEGIISKEKYFAKLKEVQVQYQVKKSRLQIRHIPSRCNFVISSIRDFNFI